MAKKPKKRGTIEDLVRVRAELYRQWADDPAMKEAFQDAERSIDSELRNNADANYRIVSDGNETERQFIGYLAIAISFLVTGLLAAKPAECSTFAAKVLFFITLVSALIGAALLIIDYFRTRKYYIEASKLKQEQAIFIVNMQWGSGTELNEYKVESDSRLPRNTSPAVQIVAASFIGLSFLMLGSYMFEALFNPDLPFLDSPRDTVSITCH